MRIELVSHTRKHGFRRDALLAIILEDAKKREFPIPHVLESRGFGELWRKVYPLLVAQESAPELFPAIGSEGLPAHLCALVPARIKNLPIDEAQRVVGARVARFAHDLNVQRVYLLVIGDDCHAVSLRIVEGAILGAYSFTRYRNSTSEPELQVELLCDEGAMKTLRSELRGIQLVANLQNRIRDIVNEGPTECGPDRLIEHARQIARSAGLEMDVIRGRQLERSGYTGIVMVGKGADEAPAMIILRHTPRKRKTAKKLALVGKAVTFDAGGYCLKPGKDMWLMKGDMAGGAAVLGAMAAIAQLDIRQDVIGIVPCAKNLVSRSAYLPGDVIRTKIGKSIHVTNTDAEGRLLLADGLIRAGEEKASVIVDIATLTGSVVRALGSSIAGIMGNDPELVHSIISAGASVGEAFWELPLVAEYKEQLKSEVADLDNVGKSPNAGSIIGGLFLQEFVPAGVKWAHLDIAGPFFFEKRWRYYSAGATGFGVRTLVRFVSEFDSICTKT